MVQTVTATLPVFTTTAIPSHQFLGYVCAITVGLDGAGNPVTNVLSPTTFQSTNQSSILTVTSTATGSQNSVSIFPIAQKGVNLFLNVISVAATCTIGVNLQEQDSVSNNFVTVYRVSLDAQATNATSTTLIQLYPGVTSVGQANMFLCNAHIGVAFRAVVSITATASQGGANVNYTLAAVTLS